MYNSFRMPMLISCILLLLAGCSDTITIKKYDPAYNAYISGFTMGSISRVSPVVVRLTENVITPEEVGSDASKLFKFTPVIKGKAEWTDQRTATFKPDSDLPSGQFYEAAFDLQKVMQVPDSLSNFEFQFETVQQTLFVEVDHFQSEDTDNPSMVTLYGKVVTGDAEKNELVEKVLKASQDKHELTVEWEHDEERMQHWFSVKNIKRAEKESVVKLDWNGDAVNVKEKGTKDAVITPLGVFEVLNVKVEHEPQQFVQINFSDPVARDQQLNGLIRLSGNMQYIIEGNNIRVYPSSRLAGTQSLSIQPGVKNTAGKSLEKAAVFQVVFESLKPAVRINGDGVIIPGSSGLIFPFEAVNLSKVDVDVVRIYEKNIMQFLQVNNLEGNREIKRVGNIIARKTLTLNIGKGKENSWQHYGIQLDELIKPEPGAIYQVHISFKRDYSLYTCQNTSDSLTTGETALDNDWDEPKDIESSYWDYSDDYYFYNSNNYQFKDNPCYNAYYTRSRFVSRNIFASDLGIIAKSGSDGSVLVTVTNLLTTEPMAGTTVEIYDFQQQVIGKGITDGRGMAQIRTGKTPFILTAKKDGQTGYLKMNQKTALQLSRFDVDGATTEKGLKGYIYGDRGVWRPGDSIYLTFILEDKLRTLPLAHPVIFEMYNPYGQLVERRMRNSGVNNFYDFRTATNEEALTGNYVAKVKVGGATFTKTIKVETVKPNRLKLKMDFGKEVLSKKDQPNSTLEAKWLHGAVARNMKADVEVTLTQSVTKFKKYSDYTFDDPSRTFASEGQMLFEGKVDENGKVSFPLKINSNNSAPGMLKANFRARIFEGTGDFSIDRFSVDYHPYDVYVGVRTPKGDEARGMILTDKDHTIQIVTLNADGNPVNRENLEVSLYKLSWRWWWDRTEEDLSSFFARHAATAMQRDTIKTLNGTANWKLRVNYPEWGRYLVQVYDRESGHRTGKIIYMDWPGWAGREQKDNPGGAAMLSFSADKEAYRTGEDITLTIPGNEGRALISIESGSKVIDAFWATTKAGSNQFTFKATPAMAPNVYVHVTLIQPHAQVKNDLPVRLYGVIPVKVEDPATHLSPMITMANELRPESTGKVTVSERNGKPLTYTLAIVDEGLLDLTRFKTPDPWNHFYAREALGVKTWDMYDLVLGAFGGRFERLLSIGGDGEIVNRAGTKAHRFKPMVRFLGPFTLTEGRKATHEFDIPQYIGSVRVMVVAANGAAYGNTEKAVPVKKPLMVLGTLPRVLGPEELVKLPVTVFAMDRHIKNVSVQIETSGQLKINGENNKNITFTAVGEEVVDFDLGVRSATGTGKVKITARSGNEVSTHTIDIAVRNPNPFVTDVDEKVLDAGQEGLLAYKAVGTAGTNSATLEVSNIPPLNLGQRLGYLIQYPHGCVEQTTSSVFPQLMVMNLLGNSPEQKQRMENNIKAGIEKINGFQKPNGGLSYWPGLEEVDDWATIYAGHFMFEAELKGFQLPYSFKSKWIDHQKKMAQQWSPERRNNTNYGRHSELIQAYRLYVLALVKNPVMSAMNQLRERKDLSTTAKWRLAAAYAMAGQQMVARQLVEGLSTEIQPYNESTGTYGSDVRDKAMILETLALLGERNRSMPLVKQLSEKLSDKNFMSTQTTAYCLLAISRFAGNDGKNKYMEYAYRINKGEWKSFRSSTVVDQIEIPVKGTKGGEIELRNSGGGILYGRLVSRGKPVIGDNTAAQNNLNISINYRDMQGNKLDPSRIEQGMDFVAEVTVKHPGQFGDYRQMALNQIFPSGWEITSTRLDANENFKGSSASDYRDIRDDRVYTYFGVNSGQSVVYRVSLNAAYLGKFYLPTVSAEAMYDGGIHARVPGQWVEVVRQQTMMVKN